MTATLKVSLLIFQFMMLSFFIPKLTIAGVFVGLDDILCLAYLVVLIYFIFKSQISTPYIPTLLLLGFSILYIILGLLQGYEYTGIVKAPTEMWQYIKRATCFFLALYCFRNLSPFQLVKVMKFVVVVCIFLLTIGFLQKLGFDFLIEFYGRNERQVLAGLSSKSNQRVFGVSGFSTSWGGMVIFIFYTIIAIESILRCITNKRFLGNLTFLFIIVMTLINVFSSGSRGAMIAFLISIFVFYILMFKQIPFLINACLLVTFSLFSFLVIYVVINFFSHELDFIIYRFDMLFETGGGGRNEQVAIALALMTDPFEVLFGISNLAQRYFGNSWGIESEPFYLLVNYGVIGLLTLYGTLYYIIFLIDRYSHVSFINSFSLLAFNSALKAGIIGYFFFSIGYFYLSEVIVGNFSWLILGLALGVVSNSKLTK